MITYIDLHRRFDVKVQKTSGCWLWTGSLTKGYGHFRVHGQLMYAHRFAWEREHGRKIPDGLLVLHECDTPACVRPSHLFVGTQSDNMRDMVAKGRGGPPTLRGDACPWAKITEQDIAAICEMLEEGWPQTLIARYFRISQAHVSRIKLGRRGG